MVLTLRLQYFLAPRRSSVVRASFGSGILEAAAFAPGLTMRELKACRLSAADTVTVQENNESD